MKKFIYLLFLASITAMAVGCSDNMIEENRVLELEEVAITFTDEKQSIDIKVETDVNNSFVAVWLGGDWGSVKQEAGILTISVDANESQATRTTKVSVRLNKGGLIKEIEVKQNGAESSLGALPEELFFSQLAGRKEITIFSNQSDWKISSSTVDWASVITDHEKGIVTIDVIENDLEEDRTLTITLSSTAAGLTKDIKITQSAILTYVLPYLKFGATGPDAMAFEEARGSEYQGNRAPYMFRTLSKIMHNIYYQTDQIEAYYIVEVDSYFVKSQFNKEKYTELLQKNKFGFEFIEPTSWGDIDIYWNESDQVILGIFEGLNYVQFRQRESKPNNPVQSKPIPTFPSYPLKYRPLLDPNFNAVKAWEATNGGVLYEAMSTNKSLVFLTESDPVITARIYIMDGANDMPGITKITTVVKDISLAMYRCHYTNIITNEFKGMLAKNGWTLSPNSRPSSSYYYVNADEPIKLQILEFDFENLPGLENEMVLCLTLTPDIAAAPSFSSVFPASKVESKPTPLNRSKKSASLGN